MSTIIVIRVPYVRQSFKVGICFTKRYLSWLTRLPETQLRELREENRKKY